MALCGKRTKNRRNLKHKKLLQFHKRSFEHKYPICFFRLRAFALFFGNRFAYDFHSLLLARSHSTAQLAPHDNDGGDPRIMDIAYLMPCFSFRSSMESIFNRMRKISIPNLGCVCTFTDPFFGDYLRCWSRMGTHEKWSSRRSFTWEMLGQILLWELVVSFGTEREWDLITLWHSSNPKIEKRYDGGCLEQRNTCRLSKYWNFNCMCRKHEGSLRTVTDCYGSCLKMQIFI